MPEDTPHGTDGTLSRRRMLEILGVTGAAAGLAGCGGRSAVETETPTPAPSGGGDGGDGSDGTPTETPTPTDTPTPVQVSSEALQHIQELAYITNNALPVMPLQEKLAQSFQTTDDWSVPSKDSPKLQTYWPTEWLPRTGDWTAKEGADDNRLTFAQWAVPKDSQYNAWNGKNFAEPRRMLFDRFMQYNLDSGEYSGYLVSDYAIEDQVLSLSVRDGATWHDGSAVTATDVVNQLKLDIYNGGSLASFVAPDDKGNVADRIRVADESTAEVALTKTVNPDILLSYLQPKYMIAHEDTYGEFVTSLDEATTSEERTSVISELTSKTVPDPVGTGPFEFADADTQRTLVTKYDGHPDAGAINYSEVEYLYKPKNQGRWNSLINNETDGSATLFMPANKVNQLPDSVQVSLIPRHWGLGLVYNFEREPVNDPHVRKAIAYVINREQVAKNSGGGTNSKVAVTYPSGLTGEFSNQIEEGWLEGVVDEFETYGRGEAMTEKAAQHLQEAGYSKSNGTWQKDGESLKIPIKGPAGFSDWVAGANTVVSQLTEFGIEAEAVMKDTSTYWGKDYSNANFVVGLQGWASYNQTYPYFHYKYLYDGWNPENAWNLPAEFQSPVLHDDLRSSETVTPADLVTALSTASTE